MEAFTNLVGKISGFVWGPYMLIFLVGTGVYLTFGLKWRTLSKLVYAFKMLLKGRDKSEQKGEGDITPFQALMTSLAATIGTGNIAGVGTAIFLGGPGAVFWMWITALFGMAIKFGEAVLAVKYREEKSGEEIESAGGPEASGHFAGGPMYYIKNGMGEKWNWLGGAFALFAATAAFGIGNTVQSNSVARAAEQAVGVPYWVTGLIIAALTYVVIIGGIKRIAEVTERIVPLMGIIYVIGSIIIIIVNIDKLGGARGVFSNEAGLGSAAIAHAASTTDKPVEQGIVAMLGGFIDTIVVCTMTALVIIMSGAWTSGETGAALTTKAFNLGLPGPGDLIVAFGMIFFAFSTILTWSYYGEKAIEYLFGSKVIMPYRYAWVIVLFFGAIGNLDVIWTIADAMNGLMIVPNLIALLVLSPVIFKEANKYFREKKEEEKITD
jgi:AGCS family alanine or glycine:cation symporter